MILTDKAKEDFRKWVKENNYPVSLWALEDGLIWKSVEYALIVEWLDSIGIHLHIEPHIGGGADVYYPTIIWRDENFIDRYESIDNNDYFNSRKEATAEAIKKANEIYNSQHFAQ